MTKCESANAAVRNSEKEAKQIELDKQKEKDYKKHFLSAESDEKNEAKEKLGALPAITPPTKNMAHPETIIKDLNYQIKAFDQKHEFKLEKKQSGAGVVMNILKGIGSAFFDMMKSVWKKLLTIFGNQWGEKNEENIEVLTKAATMEHEKMLRSEYQSAVETGEKFSKFLKDSVAGFVARTKERINAEIEAFVNERAFIKFFPFAAGLGSEGIARFISMLQAPQDRALLSMIADVDKELDTALITAEGKISSLKSLEMKDRQEVLDTMTVMVYNAFPAILATNTERLRGMLTTHPMFQNLPVDVLDKVNLHPFCLNRPWLYILSA